MCCEANRLLEEMFVADLLPLEYMEEAAGILGIAGAV